MRNRMSAAVAVAAIAGTVMAQEPAAPAPAAAAAAVVEEAPDTGLSFGATLDLYSAYVWRGCVLNDEPVWQPGATVS